MPAQRKNSAEGDRKQDLVEATLHCISEKGIQATTLREVAARAGVSNGLIRHHFGCKARLITAAYRKTIELITANTMEVLLSKDGSAHERMRRFVGATLSSPASDYQILSLWATFVSQSRVDPLIAAVRDESYLQLRRATEPLLAELFEAEGRPLPPQELEETSIIVHGVLDGLWIEACLDENAGGKEKLIGLAIIALEKILEVNLSTVKRLKAVC
ncbi:transcriptional regulator [Pseudovibrio japonicus]|uniref:Transcriptional regulator n=1 Tax=Pseudovibrio japonicus TaxID=366534 RepID=A0ABQ3EL22_9HYPH|nr:TetR family transcriptional regulator C-terminal domain-containing protein [Pseudovibrio japonicus]GHB42209.1 transcriptional regulator [Pseudovibrio japonicus]